MFVPQKDWKILRKTQKPKVNQLKRVVRLSIGKSHHPIQRMVLTIAQFPCILHGLLWIVQHGSWRAVCLVHFFWSLGLKTYLWVGCWALPVQSKVESYFPALASCSQIKWGCFMWLQLQCRPQYDECHVPFYFGSRLDRSIFKLHSCYHSFVTFILDLRKSPSCVARVFRRTSSRITRSHRNNVYWARWPEHDFKRQDDK